MFESFDDPMKRKLVDIYKRYRRKFGKPIVGRTRVVFLDKHVVYKLPLSHSGFIGNHLEASWKDTSVPIAPCWLSEEEPEGFSVLVMARVRPFNGDITTLPPWTYYVDLQQVGYMPDGRLVAFDL